jgi:hypothetical protein
MAVGDDGGTMDDESDEEDYDGSVEGNEWEENHNDSKESDLQQDEWDEEGAVRNATILDGCIINPTRFAVLIFNVATDTQ